MDRQIIGLFVELFERDKSCKRPHNQFVGPRRGRVEETPDACTSSAAERTMYKTNEHMDRLLVSYVSVSQLRQNLLEYLKQK